MNVRYKFFPLFGSNASHKKWVNLDPAQALLKLAKLQSHFAHLKLHRTNAHCTFYQIGFRMHIASCDRISQLLEVRPHIVSHVLNYNTDLCSMKSKKWLFQWSPKSGYFPKEILEFSSLCIWISAVHWWDYSGPFHCLPQTAAGLDIFFGP